MVNKTTTIAIYYDNPLNLSTIQDYQQRLHQRGVASQLHHIDKINAKFLRLNAELALVFDDDGLSLACQGMKMNPDWQGEINRLKRAGLKSEMLARACQVDKNPQLLDATAGLGHDSLLMAHLGANIILVERDPILYTLLEYQYQNALQHEFLAPTAQRIQLVFADAQHYLQQLIAQQHYVDVIYLDPMFPQRNQHQHKKAQVKKQMQLLHILLEQDDVDEQQNPNAMDLGDQLLPLAQQVAKRVIVKRPRLAIYLNQQAPDHQWLGDTCRFDGYFWK